MFRLDFRSTPEYGDPTTGVIKIIEENGSTVYVYDTHRFSIDVSSLISGTHDDKFGEAISTLDFAVLREALPGETQEERDKIWRDLAPARTSVRLWSERKQKYIFEGRISSAEEIMNSQGKVYKRVACEDQMSYLADSVVDAEEIWQKLLAGGFTNDLGVVKATDFFTTLIELHNQNSGGFGGNISKRFTPVFHGTLEDVGIINFREQERKQFDTGSTYAKLTGWFNQEHDTVKNVKYEFWITHNENLDPADDGYLILNMGKVGSGGEVKSSPEIKLRENMQSLTVRHSYGADGKTTRIIPRGGVGADGKRLDISSLPQYIEGVSAPIYSKAVENSTLAITYGAIDKVVLFDDLVDDGNKSPEEVEALKKNLLARGRALADALTDKATSISVSALDLYNAGIDPDGFDVGNAYTVDNDMLDYISGGSLIRFEKSYRLTEKKTPLLDPWHSTFTFGDEVRTATGRTLAEALAASERIFNVGSALASRLDDSSVKLCDSQADFDGILSKNSRTVYYVPQDGSTAHAYIGNRRLEFAGGGGGDRFTVQYAAVLSEEELETYLVQERMQIAARCGMTAYYGGAPSRMIINGYRVLFNVPFADVQPEDLSSHLEFWSDTGFYQTIDAIISEQSATTLSIQLQHRRYTSPGGALSTTVIGTQTYKYNISDMQISSIMFGAFVDVKAITAVNNQAYFGTISSPVLISNKFISGAKLYIGGTAVSGGTYSESTNSSAPTLSKIRIYDEAEWHFDLALSRRYEPQQEG